jgi:hypothetical protein
MATSVPVGIVKNVNDRSARQFISTGVEGERTSAVCNWHGELRRREGL